MFSLLFLHDRNNYGGDIERQRETINNLPQTMLEVESDNLDNKTHSMFLDHIGMRESSGRYGIVNTYGYLGKYQFSPVTLKNLGFRVSRNRFLSSPELQEQAMKKLLSSNKQSLNRYIRKYDGTYLHGYLITESGVLAAAHLVGVGNMVKFFKYGEDFSDGFGTKLTDYLQEFSDYQLEID